MTVKKIIIALVALASVVFIFQNTEVVSIRFLFWKASLSRVFLISILIGTGFAGGWIAHWVRQNRNTRSDPKKNKINEDM